MIAADLVMERLVMWGLRVMGTMSRGHEEHETPSLSRESNELLEAVLDIRGKKYCEIYLQQFSLEENQTDGGWTGRKNIMYCINWP